MRHGVLPRTLHVDEPTPHVDWAGRRGRAADRGAAAGRRPAGRAAPAVSSFGISGTNAHVILEQAPAVNAVARRRRRPRRGRPGCCRPRPPTALRAQAARLLSSVDADRRAAPGRRRLLAGHRPRRARAPRPSWSAPDRDDLLAGLAALARGDRRRASVRRGDRPDRVPVHRPGLAARSAWAGSCTRRSRCSPTRSTPCAHLDPSSTAARTSCSADADVLDQTGYTQPALFAVEVALFRLLESWGVRPDCPGRATRSASSPPRTSPACCRWRTRATLVAARGRLMQALPAGGAMVAVQATEDEVLPLP